MSNSGVFNIDDINFLKDNQQYPILGQLELLQTITLSSAVDTVSFDNIKETEYNTHLVQVNNCIPETDNRHLRLRLKVDSSTITSNNYRYAMQRVTASTENEHYAGDTKVWLVYNMGSSTGESTNGYFYVYNAGDPDKYTNITNHFFCINKDTNQQLAYGSATYRETNRVNGIELGTSGGNIASGSYSLYGMRFS